tara:strand:+ start:127 stop:303 length:177 start_codon:yes stop_codon:yes gene_type:complete
MNKRKKNMEHNNPKDKPDNISLENKVIEKSLDANINLDLIDNSNAYYSERYGWTLRKN